MTDQYARNIVQLNDKFHLDEKKTFDEMGFSRRKVPRSNYSQAVITMAVCVHTVSFPLSRRNGCFDSLGAPLIIPTGQWGRWRHHMFSVFEMLTHTVY